MLLFVVAAHAACPATGAGIAVELDAAETAWRAMDTTAFRTVTDEVVAAAACLADSVPPATAARLHRTVGLRAFLDKDFVRAGQAFSAARAIDPAYRLPESLVPAGHPIRKAYDAADPEQGSVAVMPVPASGHLEFDGRETLERPELWPTLAAYVAEDGDPRASGYLWPADAMLSYSTSKAENRVAAGPKKGPNLPLAITAAASLVASGTCYAIAKGSYDAYYDDASRPEDLRVQTNTLFVVSVSAAVVGLGTGAGAVIAGSW